MQFSPGAFDWRTVDLPLGNVRANAVARIQIRVGHTFVPSKLGLSSDSRALGVLIRRIGLLGDAVLGRVPEQIGEQIGEQTRESPTLSSPAAAKLVALAVGTSIPLASQDAERMIHLTGFSGPEPDGRWTDGSAATVAIRLGKHTGKGRLRLHFTPFVTSLTGQSIRVRCGDEPELARVYAPGRRCETMLDIPLSRVPGDGEISISLKIDTANSPAAVGLGADERQLGIQLHRLEFVTGFSRFRSTARWALRSLLNAAHRIVWTLGEFLSRPVGERLGQVESQILKHGGAVPAMTSDSLVGEHPLEGLAKQATQADAVVRAIEEPTGPRLVALEQVLVKLEQLIVALHEKTDVVINRTSRFLFPLDDSMVLVRSIVGYLYCSRNDHAVLSCLAESSEFEPGLRRLLERVLEPGMVFLDVGAHLGLHTLAAARRVGNSGHVFSFEPTPTTYKLLCHTLTLNTLDDCVTARRAAVGREDTKRLLYVGTISGHNSLYPLPGVETTVEVEVVQLDTELPAAQHVDVAKIDVEGAELDVLCGMSRIIAENPGILIIAEYGPAHLARAGIVSRDWLSAFSNQEFKAYVIEEPSGHCVPIEQVDLSDVVSVNIAFIRPTSPLLSRLEANVLALPGVVVIGAGGHAKVVVELIRAQGRYEVVGCTDPAPARGDVVGAPILGSDDILPDLYAQGVRHCFVALGDNPLRMKVARQVTSLGFELVNAVSPNAIVSPTARLGHGVAVMAGAVINAATVVEDLAIINTHSVVDHDCQIGEAAHVAPRATLAGGVRIGPLAFVGAGATIVPGVSVGESSIIGAGATVISNLGPNLVAVGVPARAVQRPSSKQQVDHGKS